MHVAVINGGGQSDYLYGLVTGLASCEDLHIDVIDSDTTVSWFQHFPNVTFYNLRGRVDPRPWYIRAIRDVRYHSRLFLYSIKSHAVVFHLQWEVRPYLFERFFLAIWYRILGKKIVFTAHNVDLYARDRKRGFLFGRSLRFFYRTIDRIIVHTPQMREQVCSQFSVPNGKVAVIRHGINNRVPSRGISQIEARQRLRLAEKDKVLLFFGNIGRYKNVELSLEALRILLKNDSMYKLMVVGRPKDGPAYIRELENFVRTHSLQDHCTLRFEFIPYDEIETYFLAADCLVLPYRSIFQSGVIFLAYRFGLPVVATDVGSFREDIVEGKTGFLSPPDSARDLARVLANYFQSDLYRDLENSRESISSYAHDHYSWHPIARETVNVYRQILH